MAMGIKLLEVDFGLWVSTNFGQMGFFWGVLVALLKVTIPIGFSQER